MSAEPRHYVFAPLEQRGVVAGLRGGQVALLGGGLVLATVLLRTVGNVTGVLGAVATTLSAATAAFLPVRGRPVEQWIVPAGRHVGGRVSHRLRRPATPGRLVAVPSGCAGIVFGEIGRTGESPVGVVREMGLATSVVCVRGRSFTLLDATDKERRLDAWSSVLAGMAREGGPVRSLQWVERSVPGDADVLERHLDAARALPADHAAVQSYRDLVAEAGALGQDHECFVALTVRPPRRDRWETVLLRELRLLEGQLRGADIEVDHVLSRREIGAVMRTAFDPWSRTDIGRRGAMHADLNGPLPELAWPVTAETGWSTWRTDSTVHATFWIAEWPRSDVGADFLSPLLLQAGPQRTVSVVMQPLAPSVAIREAEAARTAHVADDELRQRAGFLTTARRRRENEGIARRESELSDGHAAYRFAGYVTVTARDAEALEAASGEVLHAAHQCRLELRRLHGVQDAAFTWTLPFGRGLG